MAKQEGHGNCKYFTEVQPKLADIRLWASKGDAHIIIAQKLGISKASFYNYMKDYEDFMDSVRDGEAIANGNVQNALYKRSLGYVFPERTYERVLDSATGKYSMVKTKEVVKEVVADKGAIEFWLRNKQPEDWNKAKDNHAHTVTNKLEDFFQ